jgi:hypothetical protein
MFLVLDKPQACKNWTLVCEIRARAGCWAGVWVYLKHCSFLKIISLDCMQHVTLYTTFPTRPVIDELIVASILICAACLLQHRIYRLLLCCSQPRIYRLLPCCSIFRSASSRRRRPLVAVCLTPLPFAMVMYIWTSYLLQQSSSVRWMVVLPFDEVRYMRVLLVLCCQLFSYAVCFIGWCTWCTWARKETCVYSWSTAAMFLLLVCAPH